ncbi:ATP-dependent (S)-NAD(P)H-hydrate dehydratase [Allorhodopirellula solitaria]|uniref:ADP-dependent (S)-NAD(P)H-hydrate dehydratase n=2 Tax=Allorhodopirellula solitaria TaxID=2527987 RepID=A0A5C5X2B7_9BACT|nr:ATP-dependent (S)-NAD(P)H-hydrate dehydratase [Allorhodopirellula solitaria]
MTVSSPPLLLPSRQSADHKGTFGRVLLVGGSRGMAGSIALSSIAALHAGSGLVAAAVPDRVLETVAGYHPAIMTTALPCLDGHFADEAWPELRDWVSRQDAIGVGPGMGTGEGSTTIVSELLRQRKTPLVIDADALNIIARQEFFDDESYARGDSDAPVVLTPHPGELGRLTGVSAKDEHAQLDAAQQLAARLRITIVVKGGPTRVVDGCAGEQSAGVYVNATGNPGMGTAGCGDVLTGVITSLLGQGLSGWDAARLGVWIHGRAGDAAAAGISQAGMTAWHLAQTLAGVADEMVESSQTAPSV